MKIEIIDTTQVDDLVLIHNHTEYSNIRLIDCINKVSRLIDRAVELGHKGVGITDHEVLSSHIEAIQYVKEGKEQGTIPQDFRLILGNEIYLVDSLEEVRDNYKSGETKFSHFVLLAKDKKGHEQLRELSSLAWDNSFRTGQMERVPTTKEDLKRIAKGGHIVGSTACLGGELPQLIMQMLDYQEQKNDVLLQQTKRKIHNFITYGIDVFGKDSFYLELQPHKSLKLALQELEEIENNIKMTPKEKEQALEKQHVTLLNIEAQRRVNQVLVSLAKVYDIRYIATTDAHYLKKEDRLVHKAYLNSKEGDREVDDFYQTTYLMNSQELTSYLQEDLSEEEVKKAISNTMTIYEQVEEYDLYHPVIVPEIVLPQFEVKHIFKPAYDHFKYIKNFAYSDYDQDRYLFKLIEDGFMKKERLQSTIPLSKEKFYEIMSRINVELGELWEITDTINTKLSSYYVTTKEIIRIMWEEAESLVGVARGSVTGFYICYLMEITQLNPMKWNLPHWRHLVRERAELPDVDIDTEQSKRKLILEKIKAYFGEHRVLNIATFITEGSRSAMLTACRGLGIDNDMAQYLADMIPNERGGSWLLKECFFGDEDKERRPHKEFINEVEQYPRLKEVALGIEGLVNKRSIHASGVYIFKGHFLEQNARMKSPKGQYTTQFSMKDSDYMGGLKEDLLTIQALDKIRLTMDLLIKDGLIEWQDTLKATYDKYLHPDVLDYDTQEMWEMVGKNEIIDLFQFDTVQGLSSAQKVRPMSLIELATANSLMRLVSEGEEQPVDRYVKFKINPILWYKEMKDFGLNEDEIKVLEKHLLIVYGVADTQEIVMELSMDKNISNFDIVQSNKLRKTIAKKIARDIEEIKTLFYKKGLKSGTRQVLLDYVWEKQIVPQLG